MRNKSNKEFGNLLIFGNKAKEVEMTRNKLIMLAVMTFVCLVCGTLNAEVRYTITDLGTLGGNSYAEGINDLGQVVGYSYLASGDYHAFRWDPNETNGTTGVMVDLSVLPGKVVSNAYGINNSGHIAGHSGEDGFIHDDTQMVELSTEGLFNIKNVIPRSINESGQIAGILTLTNDKHRVFRWDPCTPGDTNGIMYNLGSLSVDQGWGTGINDNGQVCGYAGPLVISFPVGFLTEPNDSATLGGSTVLDSATNVAHAYCVNNKQHVVGETYWSGDPIKACMWRGENRVYDPHPDFYRVGPTILGQGYLPGGDEAYAYGINESDEVVGYSNSPQGERAFYWSASEGMIDLNDYIPPGSGWTLQRAYGINEIGQIVGYGNNPQDQRRAFLLTYECPYDIEGDLDDNCKIDMVDFALMANNWLLNCRTNPSDPACVLKGD